MSDLLSDLQADLATAPPLPTAAPVVRTLAASTPAVEVRLTPLRWSALRVTTGDGVALRVGPLRVRFSH